MRLFEVSQDVGSYRIAAVLAERASGGTYLADAADGTRVVLQEIVPTASQHQRALERFAQEAAALRRLVHPGLARVLESFTLRKTCFVAREYLPGHPLDAVLAAAGKALPLPLVFDWSRVAGAALVHAHGRGVFHQDIHPAHLIVAPDGTPRWTGYGMRHLLAPPSGFMGAFARGDHQSPYVPMEQNGVAAIFGARSDLYSFAALLYQVLSGAAPPHPDARLFGREELRFPEDCPPQLRAALSRALSLEPHERHESVAAFLTDVGMAPHAPEQPPSFASEATAGSRAGANTLETGR